MIPSILGRRWTEIKIPLGRFVTASIHPFDPHRINRIFFIQGAPDRADHTLILDEFKIDNDEAGSQAGTLAGIRNVRAKAYERHVDLTWDPVNSKRLARYVIYRALEGGPFRPIGIQIPGVERYADFVGQPGRTATYKVAASDRNYRNWTFSQLVTASTRVMSDQELLTMVQEACFRYYWERAHPGDDA